MWQQQVEQQLGAMQNAFSAVFLMLIRAKQRIASLEAAELCRRTGITPRFPIEFKAQFGEDQVAWELSGRATSGFYVEAGAFDGRYFSVTYALEAMGWTGLLVEPILSRYEQCKVNRPNSRVVQRALGATGGPAEVDFVVVDDQYGGMLSYVSGVSPHADSIKRQKLRETRVKVASGTLDSILEGHTGPIDLVSLDLEGFETQALRGFDLHRWKPRVLLIEDDQNNPRSDITDHMQRQAYSHVGWVECNRVYASNEAGDLTPLFAKALMQDRV